MDTHDIARIIGGRPSAQVPKDITPRLRQGTLLDITSASNGLVTIFLGSDTATPIPGVPFLTSYWPTVGDVVWVLQNGTDILVIGRLTASQAAANGTATPYTPTMGGTGATIGNGVAFGWYAEDGPYIDLNIYLAAGSTTSWSTSGLTITMPNGWSSSPNKAHHIAGSIWNGSNRYPLQALWINSNVGSVLVNTSPMAAVTNTVPAGAPAAGHQLFLNGRIERA